VSGDTYLACAKIGGSGNLANAVSGSGADGGQDIRLRQRQGTTIRLPGYGGAAGDDPAVQAFVIANNSADGAPTVITSNTFGGVAPNNGGGFPGTGTTCP
jgi:hypothetical protein